jgi:hypothetical protein
MSLYCYRLPAGVPDGIEIRDASEILAEERVVRYRSGSVALFANWFRYELQRRSAGTWLDCDAYLLAPLDGQSPYLYGEERPGLIANGVLRLPFDSPMVRDLIQPFEERSVPPWLPWRARMAAHLRLLATGRSDVSRMPWGSLGPRALTFVARKYGCDRLALHPDVLYPTRWENASWITDPAVRLEDVITPRTVSIHLWNERIKAFKDERAPAKSFLARLQDEGAP